MNLLSIDSINPDPQLSAAIAVYFARLALSVWQQEYPEDSRPEKAVEAAEKVLFSDAASADAYAAASAAHAADSAAYAAASAAAASYAAAHAANAAADSAAAAHAAAANAAAASSAYPAIHAASSAAYAANAANAAASSAAYASNALGKDEESFAHHHLTRLLPLILWNKLNAKRSFGEPEKVFELLPEACREDFLFNLDSLR